MGPAPGSGLARAGWAWRGQPGLRGPLRPLLRHWLVSAQSTCLGRSQGRPAEWGPSPTPRPASLPSRVTAQTILGRRRHHCEVGEAHTDQNVPLNLQAKLRELAYRSRGQAAPGSVVLHGALLSQRGSPRGVKATCFGESCCPLPGALCLELLSRQVLRRPRDPRGPGQTSLPPHGPESPCSESEAPGGSLEPLPTAST